MPHLSAARSSWHGRPARVSLVAWASRPCLFALAAASAVATEVTFQIADAKNAAVADAVVSLVPLDRPAPAATASATAKPVAIVQENQEFLPYVTPVRVGSPIVFPNRDTVQHHVYSVSKPKNFELPLYDPGKAETVSFEQPGHVVIGCNIHDWMSAHVLVLDTPWFAQTDAAGHAAISAPAGRYRAEVWHPRLAKIATREITLGENAADPLAFSIALKPDRRIRRGPASKGGGYR